jgi:signal transduction histidine kinase
VTRWWRSLRVQLAALGFAAIYLPVLLLFGVTLVTDYETVETTDGVEVTSTSSDRPSPWVRWTVVGLGPLAAGLAWWWAGRAVDPLNRVRRVAEDIEATDLGRRIGLARGPSEVLSLATSFDAMLDRLELAAETQRQLIEETSHELRTPLAVLATNADVVLAHPDPTVADYRDGLERSRAAAARLQSTIDGLLTEARQRARTLDRRPADLVALVHGVVDETQVLATAKDVDVTVSGPASLPCSIDAPTVRRAVANLVDNAVRHTPAGSTVAVDIERGAGHVAVAVTDHGPGIPADQQARVFERFWRAAGDGTGLGLPIARQVAEAHGGSLTLDSPTAAGDGCRFVLRLPVGMVNNN